MKLKSINILSNSPFSDWIKTPEHSVKPFLVVLRCLTKKPKIQVLRIPGLGLDRFSRFISKSPIFLATVTRIYWDHGLREGLHIGISYGLEPRFRLTISHANSIVTQTYERSRNIRSEFEYMKIRRWNWNQSIYWAIRRSVTELRLQSIQWNHFWSSWGHAVHPVHARRKVPHGKELRNVLTFAQLCFCCIMFLIGSISKLSSQTLGSYIFILS